MSKDVPQPHAIDAILESTRSAVPSRGLGMAVITHQITAGAEVLAGTEGALNLLQKAQRLLERGEPADRPRALALIERALHRIPDEPDVAELVGVRDHVVRIRRHAADLRAQAGIS